MRRLFFLCALVLSVAVQAFAQQHYPAVLEYEMQSKLLGCPKKYCVYLPSGYADESKSFPVLYLLHGLSDNHTAWRDKGKVFDIASKVFATGAVQEMVIVMPDAGTTYDGYFNIDDWLYEDYFFKELVPHVEKQFRVIGDKQHRAIAGLSMGGGGTTGYAIRHSDMFSSAYAMSALMGMSDAGWLKNSPGERMDAFVRSVIAHNNIEIMKNADDSLRNAIASVRWFIDVGDDDFLFDNNMDFVKEMRRKRIPYQLRVRDGGHTWQYWQEALETALQFVFDGFGAK